MRPRRYERGLLIIRQLRQGTVMTPSTSPPVTGANIYKI
jgi:hypothetical protein